MGNDHSQEIVQYLTAWRTISKRAVAAFIHGNDEDLQQRIEQSRLVQDRLKPYLAGVSRRELAPEVRTLMAEVHQIQAALLREMQKRTSGLDKQINALRKNTVSLRGYKSPTTAATPRYLNKRT